MRNFYILLSLLCYGFFSMAQNFSRRPNFFPIGVFAQPPCDIVKYKKAGINIYIDPDWGALDAKLMVNVLFNRMQLRFVNR